MYNKIYDPIKNKYFSIYSKNGKKVLRNYINQMKGGGEMKEHNLLEIFPEDLIVIHTDKTEGKDRRRIYDSELYQRLNERIGELIPTPVYHKDFHLLENPDIDENDPYMIYKVLLQFLQASLFNVFEQIVLFDVAEKFTRENFNFPQESFISLLESKFDKKGAGLGTYLTGLTDYKSFFNELRDEVIATYKEEEQERLCQQFITSEVKGKSMSLRSPTTSDTADIGKATNLLLKQLIQKYCPNIRTCCQMIDFFMKILEGVDAKVCNPLIKVFDDIIRDRGAHCDAPGFIRKGTPKCNDATEAVTIPFYDEFCLKNANGKLPISPSVTHSHENCLDMFVPLEPFSPAEQMLGGSEKKMRPVASLDERTMAQKSDDASKKASDTFNRSKKKREDVKKFLENSGLKIGAHLFTNRYDTSSTGTFLAGVSGHTVELSLFTRLFSWHNDLAVPIVNLSALIWMMQYAHHSFREITFASCILADIDGKYELVPKYRKNSKKPLDNTWNNFTTSSVHNLRPRPIRNQNFNSLLPLLFKKGTATSNIEDGDGDVIVDMRVHEKILRQLVRDIRNHHKDIIDRSKTLLNTNYSTDNMLFSKLGLIKNPIFSEVDNTKISEISHRYVLSHLKCAVLHEIENFDLFINPNKVMAVLEALSRSGRDGARTYMEQESPIHPEISINFWKHFNYMLDSSSYIKCSEKDEGNCKTSPYCDWINETDRNTGRRGKRTSVRAHCKSSQRKSYDKLIVEKKWEDIMSYLENNRDTFTEIHT